MNATETRTATQHASDAAVSHGDALAYHAQGDADDAAYSAQECRERVQRCHEAAAREGTPEARHAALCAAGLLMTLPASPVAATLAPAAGRIVDGIEDAAERESVAEVVGRAQEVLCREVYALAGRALSADARRRVMTATAAQWMSA